MSNVGENTSIIDTGDLGDNIGCDGVVVARAFGGSEDFSSVALTDGSEAIVRASCFRIHILRLVEGYPVSQSGEPKNPTIIGRSKKCMNFEVARSLCTV